MRFAGFVESGDSRSSQSIDDLVCGSFRNRPAMVTSALVVAEGHGCFLRRYDQQRAAGRRPRTRHHGGEADADLLVDGSASRVEWRAFSNVNAAGHGGTTPSSATGIRFLFASRFCGHCNLA